MNWGSDENNRKPDYAVKRAGLQKKTLKKTECVVLVRAMTKVLYDKCLILENSLRFRMKELFSIQKSRVKSNIMIL